MTVVAPWIMIITPTNAYKCVYRLLSRGIVAWNPSLHCICQNQTISNSNMKGTDSTQLSHSTVLFVPIGTCIIQTHCYVHCVSTFGIAVVQQVWGFPWVGICIHDSYKTCITRVGVFHWNYVFRVPETHFVSSDTRSECPEMIFSKLVTSLECPKCRHTFPLIWLWGKQS